MTIPPDSSGLKSRKSRFLRSIHASTPACLAFRRALEITASSMSEACIRNFSLFSRDLASVLASFQTSGDTKGHFSESKLRPIPGAIFRPINAASMAMVPEPQKGSASAIPGFQRLRYTRPAARVSLRGTSPAPERYPLLCSPGPVVSR